MRYGVSMWFWILPAALAAETLAPTRVQDPIEVDGVLDESAWEAVPWVEGFTSFRPIAGQPDPRAHAAYAPTSNTTASSEWLATFQSGAVSPVGRDLKAAGIAF